MRPDALGAWLLAAPAGQAAVLCGASAAAARAALAASDVPSPRRLGVVFTLDRASPADAVAEASAMALATAARAAFPFWYGRDDLAGLGQGTLDAVLLETRLRALHQEIAELSPLWARRAAARAGAGLLPRDPGLPLASELRQLALALDPAPLTLAVALTQVPDATEAPAAVLALGWLARVTGAAVVALLEPAAAWPELDGLARAELLAADPPCADDTPPGAPWAGPIEGRPHWASAAEQKLAAALAADAGLAGLFAFNQTVATRRGARPRVDLLWRAGRLAVEIDGYADHSTREAFRRDRQRDYELAISGYLVLRLTAEEVLADSELSLDKLRDAVNFRRNSAVSPPE